MLIRVGANPLLISELITGLLRDTHRVYGHPIYKLPLFLRKRYDLFLNLEGTKRWNLVNMVYLRSPTF